MKKSTLILAGLGSFLLTSVTQLPANLLTKVMPADSPVQLNGLSGTLWQGAITQLQFQQWTLQNVRWQLKPMALFKGQLAAQIQANPVEGGLLDGDCGVNFSAQVNCSPLNVKDYPASAFSPYVQRFMIPDLKGTVQTNLTQLNWDGKQALANGHVQWQNAGLAIDPQTFGNYTAIFSVAANNAQQIQISAAPDANYPLDGSVVLQADGQYTTNLTLKPAASANPMATTLLTGMLGGAQPDGSFLIKKQGKLPPL